MKRKIAGLVIILTLVLCACSKEADVKPLFEEPEATVTGSEEAEDKTDPAVTEEPAVTNASSSIELSVVDGEGKPVGGVYIKLCTGDICSIVKTEEDGKASFAATEEQYELSIYRAPEGVTFPEETKIVKRGEEVSLIVDRESVEEPGDPTEPKGPGEPEEPGDPGDSENPIESADISEDYKIEFSSVKAEGGYISSETFADYKLTFINRWEPWCGPCVSEMADIQALYEKYEPLGVNFIGVYSDEDMFDDVLKETGAAYPMVKDCIGFSKISNVGYVPVTCIVDSRGYMLPMLDLADSLTGEFDPNDPLYERTHVGSAPGSAYEAVIKHYLGL